MKKSLELKEEPKITAIHVTQSGKFKDFSERQLKKQTIFNYIIHNHTRDKERNGYTTQNPLADHILRICLVGNTHKKPLTPEQESALVSIAAGAMKKHGIKESDITFSLGMHAPYRTLLKRILSFKKSFFEEE